MSLTAALVATALAAPADWRELDPQNTLLIDTSKGRIIVEMRPDFAPEAVERVKLLAREGVYDGLLFHRVVEDFVDQTGNPNNKDGGASRHPDLAPEFTFRLASEPVVVRRSSDGVEGFAGVTPFAGASDIEARRTPDQPRRAWGAYCPGVAGMGRQAAEASANSEIFFMLEPERRLDHDYTVWGRIVIGQDVLGSLAVGEPPANPDRMTRVRVAADLPAHERPRVQVEDGPALRRRIDATRAAKGADFSVCDVTPAARVLP